MKRLRILALSLLIASVVLACSGKQSEETTVKENSEAEAVSSASHSVDASTSASVVPEDLVQTYIPKGFSDSDVEKVLCVLGDPRSYSLTRDLANTAMAFFEEEGFELELRDLYAMEWNPVLSEEEFYYQKDGKGEPSSDVKREQDLVSKADHIIFIYPNWHDTQNAMVKGYMERVFAKTFAYQNTENGLEGLLVGKSIYTINNCGFLGGGRGFIGDGVGIDDKKWDSYMRAFKVFDDDTAGFWGLENKGRFVNDRSPANTSENYEGEVNELRDALWARLSSVYLSE